MTCMREHIDNHAETTDQVGRDVNELIENRELHTQSLDAVRERNWQLNIVEHQLSFLVALDQSSELELEKHFSKMVVGMLYYPEMPERYDSIHGAYKETFGWLFEDGGASTEWDSFTKRLRDEVCSRIY
ncbi:hypothetical protein BDY21DRAFT_382186 [Lineolata rhizophorae]|uniref:Uncharacterized protein n=1 Tax=Lineolata rhizophorae TaxID=578093 RepID=A0A6A6NPG3_9PEZI|nr:hypothetical protein BDY21DRAFT_382186 [Lineolata rhizophorae]